MKGIFLKAILVLYLFSSCEETKFTVDRIIIENKSNHKIQFFAATQGSAFLYPDTTLPTKKEVGLVIPPGLSGYIDTGSWEQEYTKLPSDKMSIYIFDSDTLKKYDWENVRINYRVLKRYDLTLHDLQSTDFYVTYP
jgi:hypothetical protein